MFHDPFGSLSLVYATVYILFQQKRLAVRQALGGLIVNKAPV